MRRSAAWPGLLLSVRQLMSRSAPAHQGEAVGRFPVSPARLSTRPCVEEGRLEAGVIGGRDPLEQSRTLSPVCLEREVMEGEMEDIVEAGEVEVEAADQFLDSNAPPHIKMNVPPRVSKAVVQEGR